MASVADLALFSLIASLALASPAPYSSAPPAGSCPQAEPAIAKAVQPAYPAAEMRFVQSTISVQVMVYVNADGSIKTASVAQSSGYADADASALKAALASTYKPGSSNCKPVAGLYLFRADFSPPAPR